MLSSAQLLTDDYLGLRPCFAGLDALGPRVMNVCVASTTAVSEPRTSATATASSAGFLDGAAFETYGVGNRNRGCCRLFAGLDALNPAVSNVSVAGTSAVFKPSTTRSATTGSTGFLERATL